MKIKTIASFCVLSASAASMAAAQTNAVTASVQTLPSGAGQYWDMAIAGVTPFIVSAVRKLVPKIPTFLLPLATPLIGIGLGVGLNYLAKVNLSWVDMAKAGALAVFVREVTNQTITKQLAASSDSIPAASKEIPLI